MSETTWPEDVRLRLEKVKDFPRHSCIGQVSIRDKRTDRSIMGHIVGIEHTEHHDFMWTKIVLDGDAEITFWTRPIQDD